MQPADTTIYGSDVYAYLVRARRQLDRQTNEALFYAAFELRCGIESRLQQYLDARADIAKRKKKGWRLAGAEKELAKAFRDGRTVVELKLSFPPIVEEEIQVFHTPVTPELVEMGGRLGDLLHCVKINRKHTDGWWNDTRRSLERTFEALEVASYGTLLAPPIRSRDGSELELNAFFHRSNPICAGVDKLNGLPRGTRLHMSVQYHPQLPQHAEKFLNRWQVDLEAEPGG